MGSEMCIRDSFTVVPDWICEVVSKSTEALDRNEKLPLYAEQGVRHAWLVDPIAQTLEVRTLGDEADWREVRVYQGEAKVRAAPFEAVEIELEALWGGPARGA